MNFLKVINLKFAQCCEWLETLRNMTVSENQIDQSVLINSCKDFSVASTLKKKKKTKQLHYMHMYCELCSLRANKVLKQRALKVTDQSKGEAN